ncbi:MAG: hypothetical protein ACOC40_02535 [Thermoplasmatota archaeon]
MNDFKTKSKEWPWGLEGARIVFKEEIFNATSTGREGEFQFFEVPIDTPIRITAYGAQGGMDEDGGGEPGGKGAKISGVFKLEKGTILKILVGQMGTDGDGVGGGGGATHVAIDNRDETYTELISAGGGGAGGAYEGGHGKAELSDDDSGDGGCSGATGSAGFRGNGSGDNTAYSFINGGVGASGSNGGGSGGFGGGGASQSDSSGVSTSDDFGSGGGYQGRYSPCNDPSEGGYSYNDGSDQDNQSGVNEGHGKVIIERA